MLLFFYGINNLNQHIYKSKEIWVKKMKYTKKFFNAFLGTLLMLSLPFIYIVIIFWCLYDLIVIKIKKKAE